MYANDNKGYLPEQGDGCLNSASTPRAIVGNWQYGPNSGYWNVGGAIAADGTMDMLNLFQTYLKADLGPWVANSTYYTGGYYTNLRFSPPKVLKCPSRSFDDYYRVAYAYYSGGALDAPLKLGLTSRWQQVSRAHGGVLPAEMISLWGDRIATDYLSTTNYFPTTGGVAEVNHFDTRSGLPAGGNVGRMDGSVRWYPFVIADSTDVKTEVFVPAWCPSAASIHTFCPSDSIFPWDRDGHVKTPSSYFIMGASYQSASVFP
jgi:hypothetical protein